MSCNKGMAPTIASFSTSLSFDTPIQYTYSDVAELQSIVNQFCDYREAAGGYIDVPAAFDTETTSFMHDGMPGACMYLWTLAIGGWYCYGRTWQQYSDVLDFLTVALDLSPSKKLAIYVHNLPFEFQFLRGVHDFDDVFAVRPRKVIRATAGVIEYRCSLALTGYSLDNVGKTLTTHKIKKAVGDLDYDKIRHYKTPLTDTELEYAITDVLVVTAKIAECIAEYGHVSKIPMTKTGIVRRKMREACLDQEAAYDYRRVMRDSTLTPGVYDALKRAYMGGFTHASWLRSGVATENVVSKDITSSYPTVLVAEKYPIGTASVVYPQSTKQLAYYMRKYCCIINVVFYGIRAAVLQEHIISSSKCWVLEGAQCDNGRIISADKVGITLCDVDFDMVRKFYTCDSLRIGKVYIWDKQYLPTPFVRTILDFYMDKTRLKGVPGEEYRYNAAKEQINSMSGMCCTDPVREAYIYDNIDGWADPQPPDKAQAIAEYNSDYMRVLYYPWGVFCTAYARRNLLGIIHRLGTHYLYADTDSVKYKDFDGAEEIFAEYNRQIKSKLIAACRWHGFYPQMVSPKTIDGRIKTLGVWDDDGDYKVFKTLGAKRYMYIDVDDQLHLTVSGVSKKTAVPWLVKKYGVRGAIDAFSDGLVFPATDEDGKPVCGKLTHWYVDTPTVCDLTDYTGITAEVVEQYCVSLAPSEYTLSITPVYLDLLRSRSKLYIDRGIDDA